jgi:hypothetical protein
MRGPARDPRARMSKSEREHARRAGGTRRQGHAGSIPAGAGPPAVMPPRTRPGCRGTAAPRPASPQRQLLASRIRAARRAGTTAPMRSRSVVDSERITARSPAVRRGFVWSTMIANARAELGNLRCAAEASVVVREARIVKAPEDEPVACEGESGLMIPGTRRSYGGPDRSARHVYARQGRSALEPYRMCPRATSLH